MIKRFHNIFITIFIKFDCYYEYSCINKMTDWYCEDSDTTRCIKSKREQLRSLTHSEFGKCI